MAAGRRFAALAGSFFLGVGVLAAPAATFPQSQTKSRADAGVERPQDDGAAVKRAIEKLGSPDLEERDAAVESLHDLGPAAVPALKEAAASHPDREVRWNARRVLRDLTEGKYTLQNPPPSRPQARFRMREDAGPGDDRFDFPAVPDFGRRGAIPDDVMRSMRQSMEQLQRDMRRLQEEMAQRGRWPGMRLRGQVVPPGEISSSVEIETTNDHVKVTVKERGKDGSETVQTYEAPSMEEFEQKYPEVAKKYFGGRKITLFGGRSGPKLDLNFDEDLDNLGVLRLDDGARLFGFQGLAGGAEAGAVSKIVGPENGERLGVHVAPLSPDVAAFLGLEPGTGFRVDSVEPNSQAEALGVLANDVVVSIDGKTIGKDSTVREALAGVPTGQVLKVEVVRGVKGRIALEAKKRAAEPAKGAK